MYSRFSLFFHVLFPLKPPFVSRQFPRETERHHQELCDELLKLRAVPSAVASSSLGSPSLARPSPQHFAQDMAVMAVMAIVGGKNQFTIVIYINLH